MPIAPAQMMVIQRTARAGKLRRAAAAAIDGIRTPDGRYLVVRGRLWRTADPSLSQSERTGWVGELMEARREMGRARRAGDPEAGRIARAAVDEAKRRLGERGPVWWEDGAPDQNRRMVTNTPYAEWYMSAAHNVNAILRLLDSRAAGGSICPSDVARAEYPQDWRKHLEDVRQAARHLARKGLIEITQRAAPLDPDAPFRGPVRLRRR